jgi:hypothetical protein
MHTSLNDEQKQMLFQASYANKPTKTDTNTTIYTTEYSITLNFPLLNCAVDLFYIENGSTP